MRRGTCDLVRGMGENSGCVIDSTFGPPAETEPRAFTSWVSLIMGHRSASHSISLLSTPTNHANKTPGATDRAGRRSVARVKCPSHHSQARSLSHVEGQDRSARRRLRKFYKGISQVRPQCGRSWPSHLQRMGSQCPTGISDRRFQRVLFRDARNRVT